MYIVLPLLLQRLFLWLEPMTSRLQWCNSSPFNENCPFMKI
uniref:Uncharacterized protein n=1 Tax=Rhizophora mucronata TaxID=61149 RepID=A0A2P2NRW8_RHIMU